MEKKKLKIAVLLGGNSSERDVSVVTGNAIIDGLKEAGHDVIGIDTALGANQLPPPEKHDLPLVKEEPPELKDLAGLEGETTIQTISSPDLKDVDLVFIALHGGAGENGTIQALLDLMEMPYTGSGVLSSAVAMDKLAAKRIVVAAGVETPDYFIKRSTDITNEIELIRWVEESVGYPVVIKPNDQGSSVGLSIVESSDVLFEKAREASKYSDKVLFEKFIAGRELTVSILGNKPLPVAEVKPKDGYYDYKHKYTPGLADKTIPAELTAEETERIQKLALLAFDALDCKGYARIDFRMSPDGTLYFLEANTLPGMTPTSLVPKAAKAAGIGFPELLDRIARLALEDYEKRVKS
ncbi:MAG: D-alanine--D-alanine ligase [candidate division Zixibacteria bacterium]